MHKSATDLRVDKQRKYYEQTAADYNHMHVAEGDEHYRALSSIVAMSGARSIRSFLDVGSGTGRAVQFLRERGFYVRGIEPVAALIQQAAPGIRELIECGRGEALPFPDAAFDAVTEFGVLHHVRHPEAVIREMLRVARAAIFISDANRFGQGRIFLRVTKLLLAKCGLWPFVNLLKTRGRIYSYSDGDGIFYSYSVYDSVSQVRDWADEMHIQATAPQSSAGWSGPLLTAEHVLLSAFRR